MNFAEYFESTVQRFPHKTAMVYRGRETTYEELRERVCRVVGGLRRLGLGPGDTAAIVATNSDSYLEVLLACARMGVVLEQYNWRLSPERTLELLEDSGSTVLFASSGRSEALSFVRARLSRPCKFVLIGARGNEEGHLAYEELVESSVPDERMDPVADDAVLMHLFTSGTTGKPKTVRLTHKGIIAVSLVCVAETLWTSDDVFLQVLPLFHISAQAAYNVFILGGTLIVLDEFEPRAYRSAIDEHKVTRIGLVPSMLGMLFQDSGFTAASHPSLNTIIYAGSPMPRSILEQCAERIGCDLYAFYGMTEMSSVVGILKPADHERILSRDAGSPVPVGRPSIGTRLAVVDEQGAPCLCGKEGELLASGDGMMLGYTDPALTAQAIADGWYRTGDICYRDEDGYYYLVGRKGDMIISGGENLYPSEVEACIRRMGPEIVDVSVVGLPDETWGQSVAAVVVKRPGSAIGADDVSSWCKEHLASYKKPQRILFWDDLPRNANGKVSRGEVAKRIEEDRS